MFGRTVVAVLSAWALILPSLARADALEFPVSISDGPLFAGLKALESQTGIELLYDGNVVREFRSPAVVGTLTTEAALQQLLSETELTLRRASSGAWIIERRTTPPLAQQDAAVAEILVVGRRTQNADIRRSEEDVQPYVVATQEEIVRAHRDNIDQFISSRVTSNTTIIPSVASQSADIRSSIDLRGMGALDTIVLVDGRRMPSIPEWAVGFRQADLNAIPLHAIERIEILTGTAGGIHGFGALGGVVNVVLDRDVDGLEFHTTQGISSRGDSRLRGMEVRFGHSFNEGATDFMLSASHQELDTILVEDRGFAARDRRRTNEFAPDYIPTQFPNGTGITVRGVIGFDPDTGELILNPNLTFKPEFGGGALGSNLTHLPIGFSGDAAALAAALQQHAGELDLSVPVSEARSDLGANPQSDALFANFRHRFESGWEAYADAVKLRSRGGSFGQLGSSRILTYSGAAFMAPESPANPFNEYVNVAYPIDGLETGLRKQVDNARYTAGIEGGLPLGWRGTAEATWGELRFFSSAADDTAPLGVSFILFGDESDLETNPLGDWDAFHRLLLTDVLRFREDGEFKTQFRTQSLRLAGPVFSTRAGPTTLTLLAERRSERLPESIETVSAGFDSTPTTTVFRGDPRSRVTRSIYGELRSRLVDESAAVPMLRGLELQLAIRRDDQEDDFPTSPSLPDSPIVHTRFAGTAYTAGAKVSPTSWLMLRASYATGRQPPPFASLTDEFSGTFDSDLTAGPDPKRGGAPIGSESEGTYFYGGNPDLEMARASTLFIGAVVTPGGLDGPTFALDYSRIRRTRDVRANTLEHIVANEDQWPNRVTRAPLTDADRANGFTGGLVETIDTRQSNDGAVDVDAFDLRAEWPLSFLDGQLRLYADATYHKRNVRKQRFLEDVPMAGYLNGPLKRRANGGFDWSKNQLTVGANLQYFGSTLIFDHEPFGLPDEERVLLQGSARIPSQSYLDLYGSLRLPVRNLGPVDSFTLDLGIINVLDKAPPREHYGFTLGPAYSRYGDARMRRFELGLSCHF
ncbi:MAG TPA: TonB-dependent receptor [Steroidobacteraceae bacterium]|nr:TonB-dependent receptor [Steroidobacteraceae bacterium]